MGQGTRETWVYEEDGIRAQNGDLVCDAEDPTDCTHLTCNVGKPKGYEVQIGYARTTLDAIVELSARWHRARQSAHMRHGDHFTAGRMNGYEQAIGLLLGATQQEVRQSLLDGVL